MRARVMRARVSHSPSFPPIFLTFPLVRKNLSRSNSFLREFSKKLQRFSENLQRFWKNLRRFPENLQRIILIQQHRFGL